MNPALKLDCTGFGEKKISTHRPCTTTSVLITFWSQKSHVERCYVKQEGVSYCHLGQSARMGRLLTARSGRRTPRDRSVRRSRVTSSGLDDRACLSEVYLQQLSERSGPGGMFYLSFSPSMKHSRVTPRSDVGFSILLFAGPCYRR
jgi:hypothetical protein